MADAMLSDDAPPGVDEAERLAARGDVRAAIDLLTRINRTAADARIERALVQLRRDGGAAALAAPPTSALPDRVMAAPSSGDQLFEIGAGELSADAVRTGFARSGCVLVRDLVPADRVARLVEGIDRAIAAYDAAAEGAIDPAWFSPGPMPDRIPDGLPDDARRRYLRSGGGMWTADSPHMLFELFEVMDDLGVGTLMTEFLGERPLLSALKCTLRRVSPDPTAAPVWHQDGAFLGEQVGAFNVWMSLSRCGRDAPGLELLPKRVDRVVPSDEASRFDWSVSDRAFLEAAEGTPVARPEFGPGDALLFDQLLVHRTAMSPTMTLPRYAIEAWFFAPSAYPEGQLPLLY